ncbi:MAG: hypothetical protein IT305_30320 [Chloroflexi bacterium]|nr:hypothetical protein [Chloroflexota bacterium]
MENDRGTEETWTDWDGGNRGTQIGAFVGLAVVAALIAFFVRRAVCKPSPVEQVSDRASDAALSLFGGDSYAVGRDILTERVLPELKPAMRALLREIEASVLQGFKRAEKAIDDL